MTLLIALIEQALIALPLVIGAYITLSLLKIPDFSIESAYLCGAVCAFLAKDSSLPAVFLSAICGGMLVGFVVSSLNQLFGIPFLLAAIVTNGLFHGLTQYLLYSSVASFHVYFPVSEFTLLAALGIFLMSFFYLFSYSQLGYSFAIYGNNPQFFQNHHISTKYVVFVGVMLAHGLAGLSGFLFAQSNSFVDLTMNFGILLLCLTSLMIGKFLINSYRPNCLIPLLGVIAYFFMQQLLLRAGLNLKFFNAFQAVCILAVLLISYRKQAVKLDHLGV